MIGSGDFLPALLLPMAPAASVHRLLTCYNSSLMTKHFGIALALLLAATIGLATPLLAASVSCVDEGDADCCGLDCALCLCCSHVPPTDSSDLSDHSGAEQHGRLGPDEPAMPREPFPRDVLHVPKHAPVH